MAEKLFLTFLALVVGTKIAISKPIDQMLMNAIHSPTGFEMIQSMSDGSEVVRTELDILTKMDDYIWKREGNTRRGKRKALADATTRWPNAPIPYKFVNFNAQDIATIEDGIACWEKFTCLDFVRNDDISSEDYIEFTPGDGCSSHVGRVGGRQVVVLGVGCLFKIVIIHEIGHAIGFYHEQSRPDRDAFVTIHRSEIQPGADVNFNKEDNSTINYLSVPYDYNSIMHYGPNYFAAGTKPTITTNDPAFQYIIGTVVQFSFYDLKLANLMYSCAQRSNCPIRTCPGEGYQASNCKCYCKGDPITLCKETNAISSKKTTTLPPPNVSKSPQDRREAEKCADVATYCEERAKNGSCGTERAQMFKICRKTCNLCREAGVSQNTSGKAECRDWLPTCKTLSQGNGCETNKERMIQICRKTCGLCTAGKL